MDIYFVASNLYLRTESYVTHHLYLVNVPAQFFHFTSMHVSVIEPTDRRTDGLCYYTLLCGGGGA